MNVFWIYSFLVAGVIFSHSFLCISNILFFALVGDRSFWSVASSVIHERKTGGRNGNERTGERRTNAPVSKKKQKKSMTHVAQSEGVGEEWKKKDYMKCTMQQRN